MAPPHNPNRRITTVYIPPVAREYIKSLGINISEEFTKYLIDKYMSLEGKKQRLASLQKECEALQLEIDNYFCNLLSGVTLKEEEEIRGIPGRIAGGAQFVWILRGHNNQFKKEYSEEDLKILIDYYTKDEHRR